ncbi:MAG: SpoIID/LytB domain-containing protein [Desulfobacteraceae bacterium]|nr:MAG: SpoIID/LytB domain-containing protein [Desulfobacteraceae bacterium]
MVFKSDNPISLTCEDKKKRLRGRIWIKPREGKLMVINLVDMEDYLLSVVPSESYASWPLETLKAQAVAARTYAYYQKLHRENMDYDLVDDEGDQAYKGMEREQARSSQAVMESTGEILMHQARPILAMFSANSGGYTADAKAVFNLNKTYLSARPDPESLKGKMAYWTREFSTSDIETSLGRIGITARGIRQIEPAEKGPSGRIVKVRIRSSSNDKVFRTRTTLGRALKLPEILLEIKNQDGRYVFEGRGWGHGVGYSQWGSAIMGKDTSYRDILAFYYPGTTLEKKW